LIIHTIISHLLHLCVSFFSCTSDPQHLHSFPTRRSSDLVFVQLRAALRAALPGQIDAAAHRAVGEKPAPAAPGAYEVGRQGVDLDRKSTRLNSSHVKISYAVFCLKKKIRNIGKKYQVRKN